MPTIDRLTRIGRRTAIAMAVLIVVAIGLALFNIR
jgi:hypothetical protein